MTNGSITALLSKKFIISLLTLTLMQSRLFQKIQYFFPPDILLLELIHHFYDYFA